MINKKKVSFRKGFLYSLGEKGRIEALRSYQILDSSPENDYDEITFLASRVFKCPISFISFIDEDRLWLKSSKGFTSYEMERDLSFCGHTILDEDLLIVNDTLKDERFFDNPFVLGSPYVRFYAAAPIVSTTGHKIGTLCVMDNKVNELSESEKLYLKYLTNRVVKLLELRRKKILLAKVSKESLLNYEGLFRENKQYFYKDKLKFYHDMGSNNICDSNKNNVKPLRISSQIQSIYNNIKIPDKSLQDIEEISKIGYRINILKFFTTDCASEQYQTVSINEIIMSIFAFYQEKMKNYEIKLNVTLEIHPNFKIECKPSLTMQAFLYLLNNSIQAIKYKKYKWIHINIRELIYDVEFSVSDNSLRLYRYIDENQDFNSVSNLGELEIENKLEFESIRFLDKFIHVQGGKVALDSTVSNTKILFHLPKRSSCNNN